MKRSKDWAAVRDWIARWWHGRKVTAKVLDHQALLAHLARLAQVRRRRF